MKQISYHSKLVFLFFLTFVCTPPISYSQEVPASSTESSSVPAKVFEITREQLFKITERKLKLRAELDQLKSGAQSKDVEDRIEELRSERKELSRNFEALAAQINEEDLFKKDEVGMNWLDELQELTMPLLQAIHEISEKPRKIDKLKTKIETLHLQIAKHKSANEYLKAFLNPKETDSSVDEKILQAYQKQLIKLRSKYNPEFLNLKLAEAERSLEKLQTAKSSVWDVLRDSLGKFFRERGRNLLIASLTFIGLWWGLLRVYGILNQQPFILNKLNPQLRRLFRTIANLFIVIICVIASLISLYLLDDWLLLSISILFLMALAWTSRQLIPNFMKELRIIMNLGTVREGERIIWKGVPFLVKEIGLYTTLINEQLEGGMIRMPVGELIGLHSRPVVDEEPWFPTQKFDWVFLDDGTYGRVESQTMEQVILLHKASLKYFPTGDFISQKPINLSKGYRLIINFGLDYGIQSRVCDDIPKLFKEELKKHLKYYYKEDRTVIKSLQVSFESAGESSLNLIILVKADGLYGEDYYPLKWDVNKYLVKICNENGFVIPFKQMTVSLSEDAKKFVSQQNDSDTKRP